MVVQAEVELVCGGRGVGGAEFDGFGVVGGVDEVEADVELVAGSGQGEAVVEVRVEQGAQAGFQVGYLLGGESGAGADG
ncbi:hypothetical protein [Streptomyces sp. NPDC020681]|uniref:hypothetical protein n=1 Tax=Streptomyces sp. NPDC020681 TaxID=3365083 RepID=UPI003796BD4B